MEEQIPFYRRFKEERVTKGLRPLCIAFSVALLFRMAAVVALPTKPQIVDDYDVIAKNLVQFHTFSFDSVAPTVCRAPAYPFFLAFIMSAIKTRQPNYLAFRIADSIIDSVSCSMVFILSLLIFPGADRRASLIASLLYAGNPAMIYYTIKLGEETLSIFFLLLYIITVMRSFDRTYNTRGAILCGVTGGLLCLNKSVFLPVILLAPIMKYWFEKRKRTSGFLRQYVVAVFLSVLVITPWLVRNFQVAHEFVPVQTLIGFNFWYDFGLKENRNKAFLSGNLNAPIAGKDVFLPDGSIYHPYSLSASRDAEADKELVQKGISWVIANPGRFVLKCLDNIISFFSLVETPLKIILASVYSILLLGLSGLGLRRSLMNRLGSQSLFISSVVALIVLEYSPILAVFRYSLVVVPFESILSAPFFIPTGWLRNA